jgi:VWFA-related protein
MRYRSKPLSILLAALVGAPPLAAQEPKASGGSERIDVDVVNVDVYASDKKGAPVTDLTESDFQVLEDGKKVKLTGFSSSGAVGGGELSVVVYVDGTQLAEANRAQALQGIASVLEERMGESGPAVMVTYFDGSMHMEQDFTRDPALAVAALHRIEDRTTPSSESQKLERAAKNTIDETMQLFHAGGGSEVMSRNTMDTMFQNLRGYGGVVHRETVRSVDALTAFASALGARPGPKTVFVVADRLAMRPLEQLVATLMRTLSRRGSGSERAGELADASDMQVIDARPSGGGDGPGVEDYTTGQGPEFAVGRLQEGIQPFVTTDRFERLAATSNSSRVTLYPIKPPLADASTTGLGRPGDSARSLSDTQEGFLLMAGSTGGEAHLTGEDVAGFVRQSISGIQGHYSLGFAPRDKTEGAMHAIEVKAKGGVKLRYRTSYVTKTGLGRIADRAVGALTLGWVDNPHEVEIHLDQKNRAQDGNWDVSIIIQFPIRTLELVEHGDGVHRAAGKIAVVVLNSRGELSRPQFMELPLQIPAADIETARGQHFGARVNLRLPPGPQKVAIGLWDETGQSGSFISRELDISG